MGYSEDRGQSSPRSLSNSWTEPTPQPGPRRVVRGLTLRHVLAWPQDHTLQAAACHQTRPPHPPRSIPAAASVGLPTAVHICLSGFTPVLVLSVIL